MEKFKGIYRSQSTRLQTWDYGSNGSYFITICTKNRAHYFGKIIDAQMILSDIGQIAQNFWADIPNHFSFVKLGEFVVMPNHIHGIVHIDKTETLPTVDTPNLGVSTNMGVSNNLGNPTKTVIPTQTSAASQIWKPGTIGVIINQFKRIVTINSRKLDPDFCWQARFHDHIIRNNQSHSRISNYILTNPEKWKEDTFNSLKN